MMNYRMIIADDEEILIQLIKKLGKFEELCIEIVDECHNGEEAYQSILKHRPDFVLTDIQMPVWDGLEVIARVQQSAPETLFVLISGYRYFEYARSAIQLNVVDYLLKPVNGDQLNLLLERLCRLTDERRRHKRDKESLQSFRDGVTREKYNDFWKALFSEEPQRELLALRPDELASRYGISLPHSCFRMLALDYDLHQVSETGRFSFVDKLNEAAKVAFEGRVKYYSCEWNNQYAVLLNFDAENVNAMRTATSVFFYNCKDLHELFGDFRLTMGLSNIKNAIADMSGAAEEALVASWGWLYFGGDQIIRYDQVGTMPRLVIPDVFPQVAQKRLQDCVRYLKGDELEAVFLELERTINAAPYIFPGSIRQLCSLVLAQIGDGVVEDRREDLLRECEAGLKGAWGPAQAFGQIHLTVKRYIKEQQILLEQAGRNPVKRAQTYIHKNYSKSISLDTAAEAVGISSSYLSKVFKEITGAGFNEYLTNVRMEESKKLLSGTNLGIRDVAASVGYHDEKYYSKLFKRQFGIKPTEYRRLYG